MNKKRTKGKNIIIRVTENEEAMIKSLREKHSVNISALIRNLIREYYEEVI